MVSLFVTMLRFILDRSRSSLRWLASSSVGLALIGRLVRFVFSILRADRLAETETLIAVYHPRPSYPLHILIVPKKPIRELKDLQAADREFLTDLIRTVQRLAKNLDLERKEYQLITNGGAFQDFPYLHFHLIAKTH